MSSSSYLPIRCAKWVHSHKFGQVTFSRLVHSYNRSHVSSPSDDAIKQSELCKSMVNRNPRNLEFMGIAEQRKGWKFQAPKKQFYHQVVFAKEARHITATLVHTSGNAVVSASTKEPCISKHLASNTDIAAAVNIGRIIARRCLQAGIERMVFHTETSTPTIDAFRRAVTEGGVDLSEPREIPHGPEPVGTDYDGLTDQ